MVSLHYLYYNFCRIHQTLRVPPAVAPGVTDTLHDVNWMADLLEEATPAPRARGPYRRKNSN